MTKLRNRDLLDLHSGGVARGAFAAADPGTGGDAGDDGGGGGSPPSPPAEPAGGGGEPSHLQTLRDSLPPEIGTNPVLDPYFTGDAPRGVQGLAQDFIGVQHLIGGEKIAKPGKDSSESDWARFYGEMGRPDSPEGYDLGDFQAPQGIGWDEGLQKNMLEDLHGAGLSNAQVNAVVRAYAGRISEVASAQAQNIHQLSEQSTQKLTETWGAATEANQAIAARAFQTVFAPEVAMALETVMVDGMPLGSHPAIVESFYNLGKRMQEHDIIGDQDGIGAAGPLTPAEAAAELAKMEADPNFTTLWTSRDRNNPEVKALRDRRLALQKMANPDG